MAFLRTVGDGHLVVLTALVALIFAATAGPVYFTLTTNEGLIGQEGGDVFKMLTASSAKKKGKDNYGSTV
jgi:hypothetical protein